MVEIKVSVKALKDAMNIVKRALPRLVLQQERGHILFKNSENGLVLSATNNDAKAFALVDFIGSVEEIAFTADPKVLDKILSKIKVSEITMEYNSEDYTLKIYTTDNKRSFTTLQSFPPEKMLTYSDEKKDLEESVEHVINKEALLTSLLFSLRYLAAPKEDKKQYDFVIINKGIVFAANGLNKMGFYVSTLFQDFNNIKIRKVLVPLFVGILKEIEGDTVNLIDTEKELKICSGNERWSFGALKSNVETPKIMTDFIKTDDPYTKINKNAMESVLDRVVASNTSIVGSALELWLSGKDAQSFITLNLISNLKATEELSCERVKDPNEQDIRHVVEYKLFKIILDSIESPEIKLFINTESKFFRMISVVEKDGVKSLMAGIGSYSKVIRQ